MAARITCTVCGTVNVGSSSRCIACAQPLPVTKAPGRPGGPFDDAPTATTGTGGPGTESPPATTSAPDLAAAAAAVAAAQAQVHPEERTKPVELPTIPVPAPQPPARPDVAAPRPGRVSRPGDEIDAAAVNRTVAEPSSPPPRPQFEDVAVVAQSEPVSRTRVAGSPESARGAPSGPTFTVRLLLPEGDKRVLEVGAQPVAVGSGLDEVGLAGDPKVRPAEAKLYVADGRLWIETIPDANGIYRRIDGEETLDDGSVVLIGEIAAEFRCVVHAPPPAPEVQVLGGVSASPAGRLVFLRRDGTPGPIHDLPLGKTIVGRTDGHLNFPNDSRLSRRHVRFHSTDVSTTVEDLDSRNGTYVRIRGRRRLEVGDALRIGSAGVQIRAKS